MYAMTRPGHVPTPVHTRILRHIEADDRGCWLWAGLLNQDGYAQLTERPTGVRLCHEEIFTSFYGAVEVGYEIVQTCGERSCCNPLHLASRPLPFSGMPLRHSCTHDSSDILSGAGGNIVCARCVPQALAMYDAANS